MAARWRPSSNRCTRSPHEPLICCFTKNRNPTEARRQGPASQVEVEWNVDLESTDLRLRGASRERTRDGYPELQIVHQSFAFTLYLLDRHGGDWRPSRFYGDAFVRAFPQALHEIRENPWSSPKSTVRNCYCLRTLNKFVDFLGLADVQPLSADTLEREHRVRQRPLLPEMVRFYPGSQHPDYMELAGRTH